MNTTKQHIKLLAERFDHQIQYDRNAMIIYNSFNNLRIEEYKKYELDITYNTSSTDTKTERIPNAQIYDLIIKVLTRNEVGEVTFLLGTPIQLEEWLENEFGKNSTMLDLKKRILNENSNHVPLFGNRLEAEYYKGIIILIDDIMMQPFNVVDFDLEG